MVQNQGGSIDSTLQTKMTRYRSKYKESLRHGGLRPSDNVKSIAHPYIQILLGKKDMKAKDLFQLYGVQIFGFYKKRGRAILGLGLSENEIDELLELYPFEVQELIEVDERKAAILMMPELMDSEEEQIMSRFFTRVKSIVLSSEMGGTIISWLSSIPGLSKK